MIRNYNGRILYPVLRHLSDVCSMQGTGFEKLQIISISPEFSEYREQDPLVKQVIEYVENNSGVYPDDAKMEALKEKAETERVSKFSTTKTEKPQPNTEQMAVAEVLLLAEEIMESMRVKNPEAIDTCEDGYIGYLDRVYFYEDNLHVEIVCHEIMVNQYYSVRIEDITEEHCMVAEIVFKENGITEEKSCEAKDWCNAELTPEQRIEYIIMIHKWMLKNAIERGSNVISEVDYEKLKK